MLGCPPAQYQSPPRITTFLLGNPYKPSFATVTGRGDNPRYMFCPLIIYCFGGVNTPNSDLF